mgnify:CR=1 FL=1
MDTYNDPKANEITRDMITDMTRHFHNALLECALKGVALQARSVSKSWGCTTSDERQRVITPPHNGELLMQKIRIANMKRLFASIESSLPKGVKAKYIRAMDELRPSVLFYLVKHGSFPRDFKAVSNMDLIQ